MVLVPRGLRLLRVWRLLVAFVHRQPHRQRSRPTRHYGALPVPPRVQRHDRLPRGPTEVEPRVPPRQRGNPFRDAHVGRSLRPFDACRCPALQLHLRPPPSKARPSLLFHATLLKCDARECPSVLRVSAHDLSDNLLKASQYYFKLGYNVWPTTCEI